MMKVSTRFIKKGHELREVPRSSKTVFYSKEFDDIRLLDYWRPMRSIRDGNSHFVSLAYGMLVFILKLKNIEYQSKKYVL